MKRKILLSIILIILIILLLTSGMILTNNTTSKPEYKLDFSSNCIDAKSAKLLFAWTQTNCVNPKGTDAPDKTYANTEIQFNRYAGPITGPFQTSCAPGKNISQFDVLLVLKGTKNDKTHYFVIDCPTMHAGKINYVEAYPQKSGNFRTTCVCNKDVGGIYTSTFWENIRPFFYSSWKRSNFFSKHNPNS